MIILLCSPGECGCFTHINGAKYLSAVSPVLHCVLLLSVGRRRMEYTSNELKCNIMDIIELFYSVSILPTQFAGQHILFLQKCKTILIR